MELLWTVVLSMWLGACRGDQSADSDSLRGALEAINRRQRDLADPSLYYLEHFHPPSRQVMYPRRGDGDGQPEDIGYGYQKSLSPRTAGVFESVPVPERELGTHELGAESHLSAGKSLENVILDYIEDNMGTLDGIQPQLLHYHNQNSGMKRSVFRERDVNEIPSNLQNLYSDVDNANSKQYFENGEQPPVTPSSFRERFTSKPLRNHPVLNAQTLVRNFGGLNRDTENFPGNDDDSDEYLSMLNSIWEKYQDTNPNSFDPEDLSETDVAEILGYFNHKKEKKRQYDNSYETGYDFFNSPLAWVKRDRQRLIDNSKPSTDQFFHALKFLNGHTDTLESMKEDDVPDLERDPDVAKLLEERNIPSSTRHHVKRFWRGNTYEDYHKNVKRYPIAKRSSSFYTSPAVLYHKASTVKFNQRKKKNAKNHATDTITDPKVARELNDIFSPSENESKHKLANNVSKFTHSSQPRSSVDSKNITQNMIPDMIQLNDSKIPLEEVVPELDSHKHNKRSGQKEETTVDSQQKLLDMSKKSVDWSNYFGIDKRRKKSTDNVGNDEWLLDQYLNTYSISARAMKDPRENHDEDPHFGTDKTNSDDMDAKLRAMEDIMVDQALKYTGAHEGMADSEEVQTVKDRVIAQLAAAYSLEKMRKALSEFKSSIAAQKASASTHATTISPSDLPEQKDKRVAIKKEKAEISPDQKLEKKEDNTISVLHPSGHSRHRMWSEGDSCQIMEDITQRCKEIASKTGDSSEALVPLCNLHQVCYLCGSEMGVAASGCDMTFLSEANNLCGDSPHCRYMMRRTVAVMRSLHGDPPSSVCDWQNHPCLARYLSIAMR